MRNDAQPRLESATCESQVRCPTNSTTASPCRPLYVVKKDETRHWTRPRRQKSCGVPSRVTSSNSTCLISCVLDNLLLLPWSHLSQKVTRRIPPSSYVNHRSWFSDSSSLKSNRIWICPTLEAEKSKGRRSRSLDIMQNDFLSVTSNDIFLMTTRNYKL